MKELTLFPSRGIGSMGLGGVHGATALEQTLSHTVDGRPAENGLVI